MKAIAVVTDSTTIRTIDVPEPSITEPDQIKVKVLQVGICGTDREEASGGRAMPPKGQNELIIGHEMIGQVVETGKSVSQFKPNDFAVFTVRRGCGICLPCLMNRADMCLTGNYSERGIWRLNGYEAEFVVDKEQYAVHIPDDLKDIGVLTEPMSIVEKAIDEVTRVQSMRLPDAPATPNWIFHRSCLVAGLGPVGLLGALALRLRGADVYGLDIVDKDSPRARWLMDIGGHYIDGREISADHVDDAIGPMDIILEAAGIARLDFELIDALAINGAFVLTGIPGGDRPIQVSGAELMRRFVLKNQIMIGSVNASRDHFQSAVNDLSAARVRWGDLVGKLITHRYAYQDFLKAFRDHQDGEIKAVIDWTRR